MISEGTVISERYKILEKLGEGGMAKVYRAEDITLKRDVTLKVLKEEFISDEDFKKRFTVEARAAAGLSHPNIVTVFDVGNDGDIYYIVMEFIDGFTLKELINQRAPFENKEALGIAIHIAAALEAAHAHNVVHRDIKPHNILIAKDGAIKVTDFGIARATSSTTVVTDGLGSVHYFSPEQARGGYVDVKTDIYSLGIVLYEMVTGRLPFDGDNAVQLAMKHINEPLPDMLALNSQISKSIENIIKKATAKSTAARYGTIKEFGDDLKRAMNNDTGDFVKFNTEVTNSQTIKISAGELQEINKLADEAEKPKEFVYGDNPDVDWRSLVGAAKENRNVGFTPIPDDYNYYGENQENDPIVKKVTIAAVATGTFICVIIAVVVFLLVGRNIKIERQVVPNLNGVNIENAITIANTKALYVEVSDNTSIEAADYDEGIVYRQEPTAGSEAKTGDTITVYVGTKKKQEVAMPIFVKSYLSEAQEEAEKLGLKIEVGESDYETSSKYEADFIYKQEPEFGETVYVGSTVTVYIGTGEAVEEEREYGDNLTSASGKVIMRKVVGKTAEEAKAIIEDLGLNVNIVEAYSSTYEKGVIIKQGYEGGESVEKGKTVTLVSSLGPEPAKPKESVQKQVITAGEDDMDSEQSEDTVMEENNASAVIDDEGNSEKSENTSVESDLQSTEESSDEDSVLDAGGEIALPTMDEENQ